MKRSRQSPVSSNQTKLNLPLECQDPDDFGDFDEEQKFLLDNGALDLVLIENASELMRRVMMQDGNIEKVLNMLSKTYEGCGVLPSETFPIYEHDPKEAWQNTGTLKEYTTAVNRMKKHYAALLKKKEINCISAVFALLVESDGSGHYGSFFLRKGVPTVYIFDSMQLDSQGSAYTSLFARLATDIFGIQDVVFDDRFNKFTSLQLTGGFSANTPLMLRFQNLPGENVMTEKQIESIKLQCTESQNHFCYMWSIWSLHLRMIGKSPFDIANLIETRRVDPLTVIKRYIWSLFNFKGLKFIDEIPDKYREFFSYHWPVVWSNDPTRKLVKNTFFQRYTIPLDACRDPTECVSLSYEKLIEIHIEERTPLTKVSKELIACTRKK